MWSPYDHAADLGIEVIHADIDERGRYYPGHHLIVLRRSLHAVVERCTLAHELGHHYRGSSETRADEWAAGFLITTEQIVDCALDYPDHPETWADQLRVIPRMLKVWLTNTSNYRRAEQLWRTTMKEP